MSQLGAILRFFPSEHKFKEISVILFLIAYILFGSEMSNESLESKYSTCISFLITLNIYSLIFLWSPQKKGWFLSLSYFECMSMPSHPSQASPIAVLRIWKSYFSPPGAEYTSKLNLSFVNVKSRWTVA